MKQILGVVGMAIGFAGIYTLSKLDNHILGNSIILVGSGLIGFSLSKKK